MRTVTTPYHLRRSRSTGKVHLRRKRQAGFRTVCGQKMDGMTFMDAYPTYDKIEARVDCARCRKLEGIDANASLRAAAARIKATVAS